MARMLYEIERNADVTNGGFFDLGDYGDSPDAHVENDGFDRNQIRYCCYAF
ncbi:hypothetical protein [Arsenophonus endosymbiont of Bemisia tabaci]|uniref:hypothetical protein n=1 Tax=Arsenophonus endosymbiont of Bemisia tabaci TaxID=536059 RepID=UPI0015F67B5C|nr:hypothetical protein [Arsenophonus endosymbiont of Bemisia tabaci]